MKRTSLLLVVLAAACAVVAGDSSGAASNYPSPLKLRSTASAVTGSWKLDAGTGAADATTSNVSVNNATDGGWYVFAPGAQSTTQIGSIPTTPGNTGWIIDPAGGATGFPAGTWTFTVKTSSPGATLVPGAAVLTVGMWKGTISGGSFTPTGTILTPTDDPLAQNLRASATVTTNVAYPLPKFSLAANETLFVELWRHQVAGVNDSTDANRELDLVVNDGSSSIAHPTADDTPPSHTVTVTGVSGNIFVNAAAATVYYKGSAAGSFTLKDAIADSGSGPLQVTYPLVSTSGWTHPAETVATGPNYPSSTYSWTAGSTTSPGAQSIVAEDNALQASSAAVTLTNDSTGPTGNSVALNGGPRFSTLSVPLTLVNGTDAGAGLNSSSGAVERAAATATNGTCGTFGSFAPVTLASGADTTVTSGNCYRYRYTTSDVLGNATTSSASADAVVDTSAPTVANAAPTEESGGENIFFSTADDTVYFRPAGAGSFTLNATASDAQSGIAGVAFPDVSGTSGWTGSTGGADTSSPYASTAKYTWTANATAPGAKQITATNGTGLTATKTITISADSTAPTGQTITLNGGPAFTTLSVPLTISRGTDVGAGIDTSKDVVERASAPLANGTCGTFGSFAAVTLTSGADTTVTSGNCYRYQLKVTDNVGNVSAASAPSADAKVDASAPSTPSLVFTGFSNSSATGNVVYFRPSVGGSFTVTAASTDLESGTPTFTFPTVTGFTLTGADASRTFSYTTAPSAPLAPLTVTAKNASGLSSPAASFTLVPDPTPPTLTVTCNGAPCTSTTYRAPVTITASASDGTGAGLDAIRYTTTGVAPTATTGTAYVGAFTVRATSSLQVVAFDKVGNASTPVAVAVRAATTPTPAGRLVFGAPFRVNVRGTGRYLQARLTTTRRSNILATMTGRGLRAAHRWRFVIPAGASIVQLRLPVAIGRPGMYTVRWAVTAGTLHVAKMTRVALARKPVAR